MNGFDTLAVVLIIINVITFILTFISNRKLTEIAKATSSNEAKEKV